MHTVFPKRKLTYLSVFCSAALLIFLLTSCAPEVEPLDSQTPSLPEAELIITPTEDETNNLPPKVSKPKPEPNPEPVLPPEPHPIVYKLSFAGDCTLGTEYATYGSTGSFVQVVGNNYSYPFENVLPYFSTDDFTIVNFEGVLSEYDVPAEKTYRFRGPPSYSKILTAGNIEAVNLANNHSHDYGKTGYTDTIAALQIENIAYVENGGTALYTTESGLKIGLYAAQFSVNAKDMKTDIADMRSQGAEIVIASFHWGTEGSYRPTSTQKSYAHAAIDAGANIVFGHHPHVLQPIENYNGGVIYYSLGNFSFGGNRNPTDKDTAVIQQTVIRELDGTVHLGETVPIPFCLSSTSGSNNYKPIPYEIGSSTYERALSKLYGTFTGPDLTPPPTTENEEDEDSGENFGDEIPAEGEIPNEGVPPVSDSDEELKSETVAPDFPEQAAPSDPSEIPKSPETSDTEQVS